MFVIDALFILDFLYGFQTFQNITNFELLVSIGRSN